MRHEMFQEMLVFIGLMTTLGCVTKILLTAIHRFKRPEVGASQDLTVLSEQIQRLQLTADSMAIEVERIGEAQRFLTRTLAAPGTPPHREVGGRTTTPH